MKKIAFLCFHLFIIDNKSVTLNFVGESQCKKPPSNQVSEFFR